jgi:hypothetical protein
LKRHVLQHMFTAENRDDVVGGWPSTTDEQKALEDRAAPLAELYRQVWNFLGTINVHDEGKAAIRAWEQARSALRVDADAPLPPT